MALRLSLRMGAEETSSLHLEDFTGTRTRNKFSDLKMDVRAAYYVSSLLYQTHFLNTHAARGFIDRSLVQV